MRFRRMAVFVAVGGIRLGVSVFVGRACVRVRDATGVRVGVALAVAEGTRVSTACGGSGVRVGRAVRVLVGACVAFFGSSGRQDLHSHLAVVAPTERSSGIGWALKVSQRAWAMEQGVARIQWTYDPLESRNAYVNLAKLAAQPVEYLENFYGDHGDGTESVFPTDRLLVSWELGAPRVAAASRGAEGFAVCGRVVQAPVGPVPKRSLRGRDAAPSEHCAGVCGRQRPGRALLCDATD